MPRIVFDGDNKTAGELDSVAADLDLSKVRAMKLAVQVLHELSKELGAGAERVIRKNGVEKGLGLPFVGRGRAPAAPQVPAEPVVARKRPR